MMHGTTRMVAGGMLHSPLLDNPTKGCIHRDNITVSLENHNELEQTLSLPHYGMNSFQGTTDLEKQPRSRSGYPSLAAWIARDPDNETYVFRKFDRLSARNLLNLQNEMIDLESKIDAMDKEMLSVGENDPILKRTMLSWETFEKHAHRLTDLEKHKKALEDDLKHKIKEFREFVWLSSKPNLTSDRPRPDKALLLQSQIASLDRPSSRLLSIFSDYFNKPRPIVHGKAQNMLDDPTDLVALRAPLDTDPLSCFIRNYWPFRGKSYPDAGDTTRHFLESHVQRVVVGVSTVFAAILLVGAITSLYFVRKPGAKLGLLAAFTSLFAASVGGLTSAKRQEVFAASAAYAAVLVVFVSGDFDQDRSG